MQDVAGALKMGTVGQNSYAHPSARLLAYVAVDRIYEHIDPFEAINVVALCVRSAPGIGHLAPVRATMSFLGIQRMTDNVRALVEEMTAEAVAADRIARTDLGASIPS